MKKKCSLVPLPTDKPIDNCVMINPKLGMFIYGSEAFKDIQDELTTYAPHHLYLTSDDPIREGDWAIDLLISEIFKAGAYKGWPKELKDRTTSDLRKIIATSNPDLWYKCYGRHTGFSDIAKLPSSLIEAFVKEGLKEVMVQYHLAESWKGGFLPHGLKLNLSGEIIWSRVEEKLYTREEVKDIAEDAFKAGFDARNHYSKDYDIHSGDSVAIDDRYAYLKQKFQ